MRLFTNIWRLGNRRHTNSLQIVKHSGNYYLTRVKKKKVKKRAKHYEPKLKVTGSFIDIIKAAVDVNPKKKK